jgi:putative salt-induced outer membrane protein
MSFLNRPNFAVAASAFICLISSGAWADQIVLKNGDRVSGSIVKKDGKSLTIKADQFGVITTAWDQVDSITTDKPINVVLAGGKTVQGTIATTNGQISVAGQTVAPGDIVVIRDADEQHAYDRLQHPGWTELWAGAATLGLAGTSGNSTTFAVNAAVNAARVTNTDKTTIYFNAVRSDATLNGKNSQTSDAVLAGIGYNHNIGPRIFANVFNDWAYDKFQNLNLRFVVGGGLGYHLVKTDASHLDLLAGVDYDHSSYSTPATTNFAEFFGGDDYSLKLGKATSLVQDARYFSDFSDTGSYRLNFDAGLATKISKSFTWNVSLADRYLNHPPPGRKTNDFIYTTGIGYTFAR